MKAFSRPRYQMAVAGKVTYESTGRGVSNATVNVTGPASARTSTAPDGIFFFLNLPDGCYKVQASIHRAMGRYASGEQNAEVSRDPTGLIKTVNVEIRLASTNVNGVITAKGNKTGITMAEVRLRGSGERAFSDEQGHYILRAVEPGNRTVLVSAQGYKSAFRAVSLKNPGSSETANFILLPEAG